MSLGLAGRWGRPAWGPFAGTEGSRVRRLLDLVLRAVLAGGRPARHRGAALQQVRRRHPRARAPAAPVGGGGGRVGGGGAAALRPGAGAGGVLGGVRRAGG